VTPDEISQTTPSRPSTRDAGRMGTLSIVGSAASLSSLAAGRLVPLFGAGAEIGRRPPPGRMRTVVTLADRSVSSYHAQISQDGDTFVIEDKASTNGTVVDGRPVKEPTPLREGAVLFLGSQVLVFRTMTPAEIAAVEADISDSFAPVATLSPTLAIICAKLKRLAPSPSELFLLGETGVGKEVFANAIHVTSNRKGRMMAINCAALPRELVESELFGYERGAHSTAKERKGGLIEAAEGGTLFLDELAEMPIDVQSKLLRFLQDRKYMAIGSTRVETANVRIIAASSRVSGATGTAAIQDALLGRLGAQPILLPALRERPEDLGRLVAYFLGAVGCDRPLDPEAFQALFLYNWPHNIRELQKVIIEAELLSRDEESIGLDHLPAAIVGALDSPTGKRPPSGSGPISRVTGAPPRLRRPVPSAEELRTLMQQFRGNVAHVANHLDRQWAVISRTLQRYGIDPAEYRPAGAEAAEGAERAQGVEGAERGAGAVSVGGGSGADPKMPDDDADEEGDTLG
jgi:transcriptional regulator with PAS, ATPase and Fis domain